MNRLPIAAREAAVPFLILFIAQAFFLSFNLVNVWIYENFKVLIPVWAIDIPIIIIFLMAAFLMYFYRDPERLIKAEAGQVLSPADGKILSIEKNTGCKYLSGKFNKVSIFMNLGDVHVQRMPVSGTVMDVQHYRGKFFPAFKKEASEQNQSNVFIMKGEKFDFVVKQITGVAVRKTISWVKNGDALFAGDRIGMIRFGSRVELFIPASVNIEVFEQTKVYAGLTVIGSYSEPAQTKSRKRKTK